MAMITKDQLKEIIRRMEENDANCIDMECCIRTDFSYYSWVDSIEITSYKENENRGRRICEIYEDDDNRDGRITWFNDEE